MVSAQIEKQGIVEAAVQGGVGSWNILQFLNLIQLPCQELHLKFIDILGDSKGQWALKFFISHPLLVDTVRQRQGLAALRGMTSHHPKVRGRQAGAAASPARSQDADPASQGQNWVQKKVTKASCSPAAIQQVFSCEQVQGQTRSHIRSGPVTYETTCRHSCSGSDKKL